ncbi:hypothetical protein [Achromobacter piechaudii]|nr:hypothetical protein [Achromobacter piechaudii]
MGSILGGPFDVRMFSRIRRALNTRRAAARILRGKPCQELEIIHFFNRYDVTTDGARDYDDWRAHRETTMDTAKEWYAAVKEWQRARDELTGAIAAIKWPSPTPGCLESYDRAFARETEARERMNQAYERVRR